MPVISQGSLGQSCARGRLENNASLATIAGMDLIPQRQSTPPHGNADRLIKKRQEIIDSMYQDVVAAEDSMEKAEENTGSEPILKLIDQWFVRLTNLPTYPLDRLSRYEAKLWRQGGADSTRPHRRLVADFFTDV
jgi:hypothetical protein